MESKWSYFMFLLWISYLVISGILMFTKGFLLTRLSQKEFTKCQPYTDIPCGPLEASEIKITNGHEFHCTQDDRLASLLQDVNASTRTCLPKRAKVILIVIDALKHEFAEYNESLTNPLPYQNKMPVIKELLKSAPERTRLYKFMADPPTTTLQRLKGLTTGSLPTFIDAGSNFATPEINEDNVIDQLVSRGGKAVLLGDDTWSSLYPDRWLRSVALPSFNTWDLNTVDNAIKAHLPQELVQQDWSLLVAHFLGVDHCGHRHGPHHPEMERKLTEMDAVIRDVISSMDNNTMLFVVGDHGMTATGDHGGDTEAEVTAAMFVYSPHKLMQPTQVLSPKSVKQVDLVPTLCAILGLPPPHSNLGTLILDALPFSAHLKLPFSEWQFALMNLWANVKQVTEYMQQYALTSDQFAAEKIDNIEKKFLILSHRVQSVYHERAFYSFATDAREFLIDVRSMCQEVWIQFDSYSMSRGLLLIFLTIFFSYMIVDGIPAQQLPQIFHSSYLWCSYGAMALSVLVSIIVHTLAKMENLQLTILFSTGVISVFMLVMLVIQNWETIAQHWYESSKKRSLLDYAARAVLALSAAGLFSNSYVVEESRVSHFLFLSLALAACYSAALPRLVVPCFLLLGGSMTFSRLYVNCREEQGECYFSRLGESTQSTSFTVVTSLVALVLMVVLTRQWLMTCGNLSAPATVLWRYGPIVAAVMTGAHWVSSWGQAGSRQQGRADGLAQLIFALLGTTVLVLIFKPLSIYQVKRQAESFSVYARDNIVPQLFHKVKWMMKRDKARGSEGEGEGDVPVVCGLATVYSAPFVMLGLCVTQLVVLLLGATAAPSIILLYVTATILLLILAIARYQNSTSLAQLVNVDTCEVQLWVLLSLYFFYGTGHQAALSAIQWSAAFVGTSGHFLHNSIPATLVLINTYGSNIVTGLCLPLLVLAPLPLCAVLGPPAHAGEGRVDAQRGEMLMFESEELLMYSVFNASAKFILFLAVRMFVCMLAATVHCRHLMVWKVFAPKLIFEGAGLAVSLGAVLLSFLLLLRIHSRLHCFLLSLTKDS